MNGMVILRRLQGETISSENRHKATLQWVKPAARLTYGCVFWVWANQITVLINGAMRHKDSPYMGILILSDGISVKLQKLLFVFVVNLFHTN